MSQEENTQSKVQMSDEQITEMREKMKKHYDDQLPMLRLQAEYEDLVANIEESRARRLNALAHQANLTTAPSEGDEPKKERKLKQE